MIAYVQNQGDDPKFRYYDLTTSRLESERTMTIDSQIQLIKDFSCQSTNTTKFSCAVISSGNYITEHLFEYLTTTSTTKEQQQIVYNPYKDFSAGNVKLNGNFFLINGYSSSLNTNALLMYKLKTAGGSEWLFAGVPYTKFSGKTLASTKYDIYASPNNEKNILFAFPPSAKLISYFMLNGIRVQPLTNITDLKNVKLTFPQAPSKNVITVSEYFKSSSSTSTTSSSTTSQTKSESSIAIGFIILIITLILLILFAAVILIDYFNTGKFGLLQMLMRAFSSPDSSHGAGKGAKLDSGSWEIGVMDHSADIGREGIAGMSRF